MLKQQHAADFRYDVQLALHVVGVECCCAALERGKGSGFVEVEVESVEGAFVAGGRYVHSVLVGCMCVVLVGWG